jgi:hypothetical protein
MNSAVFIAATLLLWASPIFIPAVGISLAERAMWRCLIHLLAIPAMLLTGPTVRGLGLIRP